MKRQIFVNLPVKNLPRSKQFFESLGFSFNPQFTNEQGGCMVIEENSSYAMLKFIDKQRDYYKLPRWDYAALSRAVGGTGAKATTRADFKSALSAAAKSDELFLIDAVIGEDDISPTLKRLTDHFGAKVRAAIS